MSKTTLLFSLMMAAAIVMPAQPPPGGPPPGGPGPGWGGRGPRGGDFGIVSAGPGSRTPVTGAPYSAIETSSVQQKLADGNQITRQEQSKIYRDNQGRVRVERTGTPPGAQTPETRITIFDPVAGFSYVLNPAAVTVVKMPVRVHDGNMGAAPPARSARPAPANPPQMQTETLSPQLVNGVQATGTRTTTTIAAGTIGNQQAIKIVREVWVSAALKIPVQIKTSDPRFGATDMEVTNILQAEPDPALFQVPANYTETTMGRGGPDAGPQGMRSPRRQAPAK